MLTKTKQCRNEPLPFTPGEPQTPFSSSGTLDFLSTYLEIGSLNVQPIQYIKKQRHYFANKGPYSQSYGLEKPCMDMRVGL